jgi:hypothetical protein
MTESLLLVLTGDLLLEVNLRVFMEQGNISSEDCAHSSQTLCNFILMLASFSIIAALKLKESLIT